MIFVSNHPIPQSSKYNWPRERFKIMTIPVSVKKYATTVDPYQKVLLTPNPLTEEESEVEEVEGTGERQE